MRSLCTGSMPASVSAASWIAAFAAEQMDRGPKLRSRRGAKRERNHGSLEEGEEGKRRWGRWVLGGFYAYFCSHAFADIDPVLKVAAHVGFVC
ncbi:hypothetical protein NL676_023229 [Syzygium grande]|nr:hypothetical protein NL676_023229 [Syzygium grande]